MRSDGQRDRLLADPRCVGECCTSKLVLVAVILEVRDRAGVVHAGAYTGFAQIASKIQGDVTPQSFLAAASKATVDTGGMTPVFDFSKTWDAFNGQYARSFSSKVTYFKLSDNSQIGDSVYVDLTNALQGKPN